MILFAAPTGISIVVWLNQGVESAVTISRRDFIWVEIHCINVMVDKLWPGMEAVNGCQGFIAVQWVRGGIIFISTALKHLFVKNIRRHLLHLIGNRVHFLIFFCIGAVRKYDIVLAKPPE